jgi:AcrR family transcriptional regulator
MRALPGTSVHDDSAMGAGGSGSDDLWAEFAPGVPRRLLTVGVDAFADLGYHATTTREIAQRAGLSPAGIYVHFRSKGELLYHISRVGHEAALAALQGALEPEGRAVDRIERMIARAASWHAEHHRLARVVQYELDAVPLSHREEIARLRREFEATLMAEIRRGVEAGEFVVDDVEAAAWAMLSLCIDVARWYQHVRRPEPNELGERYGRLVARMLGSA